MSLSMWQTAIATMTRTTVSLASDVAGGGSAVTSDSSMPGSVRTSRCYTFGAILWKKGGPMRDIVGSCLCGKIRYSATADPAIVAVCHCKNCQKQGGTAFSVVVAIPRTAMKITGPIKTYNDISGTGKPVQRK